MEEGKEMSLKKQAQGMKEEEQAMLPLPLGAWRELLRKSTLERGQGPGILPGLQSAAMAIPSARRSRCSERRNFTALRGKICFKVWHGI